MSDEHANILDEIESLIRSLNSIQIATLNCKNHAEISYTPFLRYSSQSHDRFYIFISELAAHTNNIKQHAELSLLFIEDEQTCKNIFARKRLILECNSRLIDRESKSWGEILNDFEAAQGKTVSLLKTLPDFHLFELTAARGTYIKGFGQAFSLSGENLNTVTAVDLK